MPWQLNADSPRRLVQWTFQTTVCALASDITYLLTALQWCRARNALKMD